MSVNFANYPRLEIPEGRVKQIARKSDGLVLWTAGYVNMVPLSTNSDGTIYNGIGYKNDYRVRSGGAEAVAVNASCSGFIPVKGGDVVRVGGINFAFDRTDNAINVNDSGLTNLGQLVANVANGGYGIFSGGGGYYAYGWQSVVEESDGVWKWIVPPAASGVAYIRVTGYTGGDGSKMIVTVNEEITL